LTGGDEGVIHVELAQLAVQVIAESIIPGAGDHAGPAAVAGGGNGYIGRGTAKVFPKDVTSSRSTPMSFG
jgi:hypothetical protein